MPASYNCFREEGVRSFVHEHRFKLDPVHKMRYQADRQFVLHIPHSMHYNLNPRSVRLSTLGIECDPDGCSVAREQTYSSAGR